MNGIQHQAMKCFPSPSHAYVATSVYQMHGGDDFVHTVVNFYREWGAQSSDTSESGVKLRRGQSLTFRAWCPHRGRALFLLWIFCNNLLLGILSICCPFTVCVFCTCFPVRGYLLFILLCFPLSWKLMGAFTREVHNCFNITHVFQFQLASEWPCSWGSVLFQLTFKQYHALARRTAIKGICFLFLWACLSARASFS